MPPTSVAVETYVIGAANIYYRDPAVLTAWNSVGLTMDDAIARIGFENNNPSDALNHLDGSLRGLDYLRVISAEIEFTLPELSADKLALAIPGSISTAGVITETGAGFSTTLAADTAIGATNIKLTAVSGLSVGEYLGIDVVAGGLREYRQVTAVGTLGAGGTGVDFRDPLKQAHLSGVVVIETDGDGKTEVTPPTVRRQPNAAYKDWALVSESPADYFEFLIYRAIATSDTVELSFNDDLSTPAGIRVTLGARKDETDLTLPLVRLRLPAA
jgi:hypothetical protein